MKTILLTTIALALLTLLNIVAYAQESQYELLKNFQTTSLNVFKVTNPKHDKYFFEKAGKPWEVRLERNGDAISKLIVNRAGVIEEPYEPDLAVYPAYFKDLKHRVVFVEENFYYIQWASGKATIKYVLTPKDDIRGDYQSHITKIENYINKTVAAQSEDRSKLAEQKAAQEAAEAKLNSLEGKSVKSIAIKWINTPTEVGHMSKIPYGIEATLADGKVLKTKNLGGKTPWDDFKITVQGAEFGEELLTIEKDASKIPNDYVLVQVQSKYHPTIKASAQLPIVYNAPVFINYNGKQGGVVHLMVSPGYRGGDGKNLIVLVTAATTANGEPINKVEIRDAQNNEVLHRLKLAPSTPLTIYTNGGSGSFGRDSTQGGNGGNGGNVTILKDSNVGRFSYTVSNQGGSGGKHERLKSLNGQNGVAGSTYERVSSVLLSW